jgi:MFS transporter, PPP family, 3-phenylpropionic acid transporter
MHASSEPGRASSPALVTRIRLNYFFFYAAIGAFWPYLGPHLRELGLSGTQIGILSAAQPIAVALLAPAIGAFADRRALHRRVMQFALIPSATAVLLLSQATAFPSVLLLFVLWACSIAAVAPILDSYAITIGDATNVPYGRLRLAGTFGYIICVIIVGNLLHSAPSGTFLIIYAGMLLVMIGAAALLPPNQNRAQAAGPPLRFDLREAVGQPALIAVLVMSFLTAVGMSTLGSFLSIHLTDLGATSALLGVASALLAVGEIPIMMASGWLQRRLGNHRLIIIALVVYIIRFVLYATAQSAYWVLPVQLLNGLSFALFLLASVRLVYDMAGRGRAATMQSVLAASTASGQVLGAVLTGFVADAFGVRSVFIVAAVANVIALVVFAFAFKHLRPVR